MRDTIYISKLHGAKLKDEELTQKVSEGLGTHENKLELLHESIPYEWQYANGRTLLHWDYNEGCYGIPYEFDVDMDQIYINCTFDADGGGLYFLDAWSYRFEDIEGGGRRWFFKSRHDDAVDDGYYVFVAESGSEQVKQTGYGTALYWGEWEDKEDVNKGLSLVSLYSCYELVGMTKRSYSDTYYTDPTSGKKLQTAPDVYTFDSIEDAFYFTFDVYKPNGETYKTNINTVSGVIDALNELGFTEYTQTIISSRGVPFYLDISADSPLVLGQEFTHVVYGGVDVDSNLTDSLDCDIIAYTVGGVEKIQKVCRRFTVRGR